MSITYIKIASEEYELPPELSLSYGQSYSTTEKRMYDGTITPRAIAILKRPQIATYTATFNITKREVKEILEYIENLNNIVGKTGMFYYNSKPVEQIIIAGIAVNMTADASTGITGAAITINMRQNTVITQGYNSTNNARVV